METIASSLTMTSFKVFIPIRIVLSMLFLNMTETSIGQQISLEPSSISRIVNNDFEGGGGDDKNDVLIKDSKRVYSSSPILMELGLDENHQLSGNRGQTIILSLFLTNLFATGNTFALSAVEVPGSGPNGPTVVFPHTYLHKKFSDISPWLKSGEMKEIFLTLQIPSNIPNNTMTLISIEATAYGATLDQKDPSMEHHEFLKFYFVSSPTSEFSISKDKQPPKCWILSDSSAEQCANITGCHKNRWNAKIKAQDKESGLWSIAKWRSAPSFFHPGAVLEFYSRDNFVIGSNDFEYFEYNASCCIRLLNLSVIDVKGNSKKCYAGLDADSYNNSQRLNSTSLAILIIGIVFLIVAIIILSVSSVLLYRKLKGSKLQVASRSETSAEL